MKEVVDGRCITEAIDEILAEVECIASEYEVSLIEVLIQLGLAALRDVSGDVPTEEERVRFISGYLNAIRERAIA